MFKIYIYIWVTDIDLASSEALNLVALLSIFSKFFKDSYKKGKKKLIKRDGSLNHTLYFFQAILCFLSPMPLFQSTKHIFLTYFSSFIEI